jgi:hypothetical protein
MGNPLRRLRADRLQGDAARVRVAGVLYWVPVVREIVISVLNVNVYVAGLTSSSVSSR